MQLLSVSDYVAVETQLASHHMASPFYVCSRYSSTRTHISCRRTHKERTVITGVLTMALRNQGRYNQRMCSFPLMLRFLFLTVGDTPVQGASMIPS